MATLRRASVSMVAASTETFAAFAGVAVEQSSIPFSPGGSASVYNGERDSVIDHTSAQMTTLRKAMPMASGGRRATRALRLEVWMRTWLLVEHRRLYGPGGG